MSSSATPITGGASSSRPAGDAAALQRGECGPAASPHSSPGHDLITIHVSAATASLLAVLAAEHGDSLGGMVARLAVADIERKGGIARV